MSRLKADRKENQRRRSGSEEQVVLKPGHLNQLKYKEQIHRKPWTRGWWEENWVEILSVEGEQGTRNFSTTDFTQVHLFCKPRVGGRGNLCLSLNDSRV